MSPYAKAIIAYHRGNTGATLTIRRDDGIHRTIPVSDLYEIDTFSEWEQYALSICRGLVLDAGAGAGRHSLALQARGLRVIAAEIDAALCTVLAERGLDAVAADVLAWHGPRVDTLLMLMNGIGMTGNPAGLDAFLARLGTMLAPGGQALCDSVDVLSSEDPARRAYGLANLEAGRYPGQHSYALSYGGEAGPPFEWLHLSHACLARHCAAAGLACELRHRGENGHYLARITVASRRYYCKN